jgi:hypothetical protein
MTRTLLALAAHRQRAQRRSWVNRNKVGQKQTGRPVRFELSEQTRQAVDDYLKAANKKPREFLFTGRSGTERGMTT